jgi:hypothetical protein
MRYYVLDSNSMSYLMYEGVSKSFRTGRLQRELQIVQLSVTRCSCIVILWVSLVSFAAITFCIASQRVFVVYFVIDSVRKLLDTHSYKTLHQTYIFPSNHFTKFSVQSVRSIQHRTIYIICFSHKYFYIYFPHVLSVSLLAWVSVLLYRSHQGIKITSLQVK